MRGRELAAWILAFLCFCVAIDRVSKDVVAESIAEAHDEGFEESRFVEVEVSIEVNGHDYSETCEITISGRSALDSCDVQLDTR